MDEPARKPLADILNALWRQGQLANSTKEANTVAQTDFVFVDAASKPWRVALRSGHEPGTTRPWFHYWSVYEKWVPLREASEEEVANAGMFALMPAWQAQLYHDIDARHT